jgi:hypothetical protein
MYKVAPGFNAEPVANFLATFWELFLIIVADSVGGDKGN